MMIRAKKSVPSGRRQAAPRSVLGWLAAAALASAAPLAAQSLQDRVNRAILNANLNAEASVAVDIYALESDASLASVDAERPLIPASNMKLLTSVAAIRELGSDFVFRTYFVMDDEGTLTVLGSGDPGLGDPVILELASPAVTLEQILHSIAETVAASGTTELEAVVIDDRVFDRDLVHPGWPADQLDRHYSAPVSGVNVHRNVVSITPRPSRAGAGARAEASIAPRASWVTLDIRANTTDKGGNTFRVERGETDERFTLRGRIRQPSTISGDVALRDPATFFGGLVVDALEDAGVSVGEQGRGALEKVVLAQPDAPAPSAEPVAWIDTPLANVIERCNVDSQNLYAEALLKRVGAKASRSQGSWANGAAAVRRQIAGLLGADAATRTIISDGSGLSRDNRVTAATLVRWLDAAYEDDRIRDALIASLPGPGEGTLRRRFRDEAPTNTLRAKTGTIRGVSALSGYLIHEGTGLAVAFSVMANDLKGPTNTQRARKLQEAIVLAIDEEISRIAQGSAGVGTVEYGG